jgi:hypothetical protein
MLHWTVTGFLLAFAATLTYFSRGSPFRPGADPAEELGYVTGAALMPFILGALVALALSPFLSKSPGAFHRRMNWAAALALILLALGRITAGAR